MRAKVSSSGVEMKRGLPLSLKFISWPFPIRVTESALTFIRNLQTHHRPPTDSPCLTDYMTVTLEESNPIVSLVMYPPGSSGPLLEIYRINFYVTSFLVTPTASDLYLLLIPNILVLLA